MSEQRNKIVLYVNGQRHEVAGQDAFSSLSDFLRYRLHLVGTKIVCSEGDCGSCTVLCGRLQDDEIVYRPIDSCIQLLFQLDGTHIVTVEGLKRNGQLSPVQQSMVDCHGSQCGFCTPGFVVAMTGLLEDRATLDEDCLRAGLTGNLCRCTGYSPIIDAGLQLDHSAVRKTGQLYPADAIPADLAKLANSSFCVEHQQADRQRTVFSPVTLAEAADYLELNPKATLVAGATDIGVQLNKRRIAPDAFVDLNRLTELAGVEVNGDEVLAGARATWTELETVFADRVPEFGEIISVFGSPQIRHAGTLGGNIANASPIADSLPFLYVMEAELELYGPSGTRTVNINDFYRGYKKFDLNPGELIAKIRIPLPTDTDELRLYKVSRRRDLDIATFTAAIRIRTQADIIRNAAIAFGAVGPTILRAPKTESFLIGKQLSESTMQAAGDIAVTEITPITDVRGQADYRYRLARNVLKKFYHQQAANV